MTLLSCCISWFATAEQGELETRLNRLQVLTAEMEVILLELQALTLIAQAVPQLQSLPQQVALPQPAAIQAQLAAAGERTNIKKL